MPDDTARLLPTLFVTQEQRSAECERLRLILVEVDQLRDQARRLNEQVLTFVLTTSALSEGVGKRTAGRRTR